MRINRKVVFQMTDTGFVELERESYEYNGPVAKAFGGGDSDSSTTSTSEQTITTTSVGLQDITGFGIATGGDLEFNQTVTDHGATQGAFATVDRAFDFAGEFGSESFGFARDVVSRSHELQDKALGVTGGAIQTVGDASRSDTTDTFRRIALYVAVAAGIFFAARALRK